MVRIKYKIIKKNEIILTLYLKNFEFEEKFFQSPDRWLRLHINSDLSIEYCKQNQDGTVSPISLEKIKL